MANDTKERSAEQVTHHNPEAKQVVAVLGQFRGGTSCVAGLLHHLGVSMGHRFAPPAPGNRKGTWEAQWLAQICRQSFKEPWLTEELDYDQRVQRLSQWIDFRLKHTGDSQAIGDTVE